MENNYYNELTEITVKTQEELDMIPLNFKGRIYIEFGTNWSRAVVKNRYYQSVVARGNSFVEAWGDSFVVAMDNSFVEAMDNSSVVAWGNSSVVARGNSFVEAWGNSSVEAMENSSVEAMENSSVVAWGNSSVEAMENSSVVASGNSSVVASGNSSVVAWGNSSVVARGNSFVEAWGNSSVEAMENSSVEAMENSSVVAWGNSSVEARGNSQIVDRHSGGKIEITGNARIVYMPKTIEEYCSFHGLKHDKKTGVFYKCVRKKDDRYISDKDSDFEYRIGEKAIPDRFDDSIYENYGHGIHVAYLAWALDYGKNWSDLAIIEVEAKLDDIVIPKAENGNVRCKEVIVLREVPLEECGVYGKILAKRRKQNNK